jgi:hypothetical protein
MWCVFIISITACSSQSSSNEARLNSGELESQEDILQKPQDSVEVTFTPETSPIFPTVTTVPSLTPTPVFPEIDMIDNFFTGSKFSEKVDFSETIINYGEYGVTYKSREGFLTLQDTESWLKIKKYFKIQIDENEGVFMRFKFSPGSTSRVYLKAFSKDNKELRWGLLPGYFPRTYIKEGTFKYNEKYIEGDLILHPDHWYHLIIGKDNQMNFKILLWDPINPEIRNEFQQEQADDWNTRPWELEVGVISGDFSIGEIWEFTFNEIK